MDMMFTIPAAVGLGALHSLEPGHGKGVITAYLISSGARIKDAVFLGIVSAAAHTLSIALLAFSASSAVKAVFPQYLTAWFQLLSGVIILYIGLNIIYDRLKVTSRNRSRTRTRTQSHPHLHSNYNSNIHSDFHSTAHDHSPCCEHEHCGHHHTKPLIRTSSQSLNLFLMGLFTGLIPCPSALAILLAAVSADKIPLGLCLVAFFSAGSAVTMVTLGVLVVRAGKSISKLEKWNVMNGLALASSFLILFLGGILILQSVRLLGIG